MVISPLCLNAPDGAGCFPTDSIYCRHQHLEQGLNAPDGAGCFPTVSITITASVSMVSMHLMVLGASRRTMKDLKDFREDVSMHLMVLGASRRGEGVKPHGVYRWSQCT